MYPFVRCAYLKLDTDSKKELCSYSYRLCATTTTWNPSNKQAFLELFDKILSIYSFIKKDIGTLRHDIESCNPVVRVPSSAIQCIRSYFQQFYTIKERKLCLPIVETETKKALEVVPQTTHTSEAVKTVTGAPTKIRAITEETWWVIRVKNDYRMCKLTFDRGEYWEMVEYHKGKVHNPRYKFPKYDNRIVYEFKEHLVPAVFDAKIQEAISIRKAALTEQAQKMLSQFEVVLIARHLTGGTLVGGVEAEDENYWYLDTYNEKGEHIFYGDNRWKLEKKSRCTVLQTLKRK